MIKSITHSGISVSDLEKSIAFYKGTLGLKVVARLDIDEKTPDIEKITKTIGIPGARYKMALMGTGEKGAPVIEIVQWLSPIDGQPLSADYRICNMGPTHIAFKVTKIEKMYNELVAKGINFFCPPQTLLGQVKVVFLRDPDGIVLELTEEKSE